MGFFGAALKGFTEPILRRQQEEEARRAQVQQLIAQVALQGVLDPNTDPDVREQYRRILADNPLYAGLAGLEIPDTPAARLRREVAPLLSVAQIAGTLGPTGLLTPGLAAQLEEIVGRPVFPRRTVTEPGPVLEPARPASVPTMELLTGAGGLEGAAGGRRFLLPGSAGLQREGRGELPEVRGAPTTREEIDVSRFGPGVRIRLHTGQEVALDDLKGLPTDFVMYLIQGPTARPAQTYGQLFGEALKPEWRGVPIQVNDQGRIVFPPEHAFVPTPTAAQQLDQARFERQQQAIKVYQQTLDSTGDVSRAWVAASRIDPITFKPDLPTATDAVRIAEFDQRLRATDAYNDVIRRGGTLREAYEAAFGIDPSFPRPATLPGEQTPQQAAWAKFFERGFEGLTPGERAYIESQLRQSAQENPRFRQAMQTVATLSLLKQRQNGRLTTQQQATLDAALAVVAETFGVEPTMLVPVPPTWWQRLWNVIAPGALEVHPTREAPRPGTGTAQAWAQQQLEIFRTRGGAKTKQELQREFNKARKHPALKDVPLAYWRALQEAINALP